MAGRLASGIIGAIITVILLLIPGINILAPLIGGFIAGLLAGGAGRGAQAGFLAGVLAAVPVPALIGLMGTVVLPLNPHIGVVGIGASLVIFIVASILLGVPAAIAGLIGGALKGER